MGMRTLLIGTAAVLGLCGLALSASVAGYLSNRETANEHVGPQVGQVATADQQTATKPGPTASAVPAAPPAPASGPVAVPAAQPPVAAANPAPPPAPAAAPAPAPQPMSPFLRFLLQHHRRPPP